MATITRYRSSHAPGVLAQAHLRRRDAGEGEARPEDLPDVAEDAGIGLVPSSWDPETRQIDVVLSTGSDVRRYDWWTGKEFVERLSLDPAHVDLGRMNAGAPWLRVHNAYSLDAVLGVIIPGSVRIEGEDKRAQGGENAARMLGRVQLSDTPGDADVVRKIGTGIIRGVSIAYDTEAELVEQAAADKLETRTAVLWGPFEGSSVPVGADAGAGTRNRAAAPPAAPPVTAPAAAPVESDMTTATNPATGATLDEGAIRAKAQADERARVKAIRQCAKATGTPDAEADKLVEDGTDLEAARTAMIEAAAKRDKAPTDRISPALAEVTDDAKDKRARGISNALMHRGLPGKVELDDEGRHYRGMSLVDIARDFLEEEGVKTRGLTPSEIAGKALHFRAGYATVADFPNILADVPRKAMRKAYTEAATTYQEIANRSSMTDFRKKYGIQIGAAPNLERVGENGEFKRGSIVDGAEAYGLETYGKILQIGRRVIVNDDMRTLTRLPAMMAAAAKRLENVLTWGVVLDNIAMSDGKPIFHADHANLVPAGQGGGATTAQIAKMRSLLKMQTDLSGATRLALPLRTIVVPDALFTDFEKFLKGTISPASSVDVVPDSMRQLRLLTDPILDDVSLVEWFGFADLAQIDGVEYAYLEGEEGPSIDSEVDFDSDGMKLRIRHDFGAGCMDWRGMVKNAGQ